MLKLSYGGYLARFVTGPLVFLGIYSLGVPGLSREGTIILATLGWAVIWWVLRPIPWGATSLLPLVVFPFTQTMPIQEAARLYGQSIFFWIMGTSLLAHAIQKHGLAKRFAVAFLRLPGVAATVPRLLFFYMLATGLVSWFVSDASTIALMMPLGFSLCSYIRNLVWPDEEDAPPESERLKVCFALGTLYAAVAGGVATVAGAPHNAVAVAQFEALTHRTIGWFTWMRIGVPVFLTVLIADYFLLRWLFPVSIRRVPGIARLLNAEQNSLGKMRVGESLVFFIFLVAVGLFTLPPLLPMLLGDHHPLCEWLNKVMSVWIVPPILLLLLFGFPTDLRKKEYVLEWKDAAGRVPWHILLMVTSAVGMTEALADRGFLEIVREAVREAPISPAVFPYFVGIVTSLSTNFISGVAVSSIYTGMLIPIAQHIGLNPIAVAFMVPCTAVGVIFPWAGPTVGTAFGFGAIPLKDLIRVGLLAEIILIVIGGTYVLLLASAL